MTGAVVTPTVGDAVRSHVSWMTALAGLPGGTTWTDGPLHWAYDAPYGTVHALFPDDVSVDAARRGLERARSMDAAHVAIWSAVDVERRELEEVGFEVGWQPWWMGRSTAGVDEESLRLARRAVLSAWIHRVGAGGGVDHVAAGVRLPGTMGLATVTIRTKRRTPAGCDCSTPPTPPTPPSTRPP